MSENASNTEPARVLVIFVADDKTKNFSSWMGNRSAADKPDQERRELSAAYLRVEPRSSHSKSRSHGEVHGRLSVGDLLKIGIEARRIRDELRLQDDEISGGHAEAHRQRRGPGGNRLGTRQPAPYAAGGRIRG